MSDPLKIRLALPGPRWNYGSVRGAIAASDRHEVQYQNSSRGWDDMNVLWVEALNVAAAGNCTHFALLHSDITPADGWLDTLVDVTEAGRLDFVSVPAPLKDRRGLTSCGAGDRDNHWDPFRRWTVRETLTFPETFTAADTPHPDRYLLHNTGCCVADLRNPVWRTTDSAGILRAVFAFPIRAVRRPDGSLAHQRESEDWYFSRAMADLGLKTAITRKVRLTHAGEMEFANDSEWGSYRDGDEDTRSKWAGAVVANR